MCSLIWGTAFVAQDMGMDFIGPYTFTSGRMFLGFFALLPFFFIFEFKKAIRSNLSFKIILSYLLLLGFFLAAGNKILININRYPGEFLCKSKSVGGSPTKCL